MVVRGFALALLSYLDAVDGMAFVVLGCGWPPASRDYVRSSVPVSVR